MDNTITISEYDDFWENRAHGDTSFPCAFYCTDSYHFDVRWHWHEEYECSFVRSGSCPAHFMHRKLQKQPKTSVKKILFFTDA